jgi:hypothetical protein
MELRNSGKGLINGQIEMKRMIRLPVMGDWEDCIAMGGRYHIIVVLEEGGIVDIGGYSECPKSKGRSRPALVSGSPAWSCRSSEVLQVSGSQLLSD